jgi:hypothetical protein
MNLENFFEDLEVAFEARLGETSNLGSFVDSSLLEIVLCDGRRFTLAAPIVGLDFCGGAALDQSAWTMVLLKEVQRIEPVAMTIRAGEPTRFSGFSAAEILDGLKLPASIRWVNHGSDQVAVGQLLGQHQQVLVVESAEHDVFLLPLASLAILELLAVNNLG